MGDSMIQCQCYVSCPPSLSLTNKSSIISACSASPATASYPHTHMMKSNQEESHRRGGALRAQAGEVEGQAVIAATDDKVGWWEKDFGAIIRDLHSTQELSEAISAASGKLVIVEFFATWCGSCRALYPKLCKLAAEHPDIAFVKINFDENKALCKSLNVKVLPYFHFYGGTSTQLESFSCSVTKLQKLKDAIAKYEAGGQPASLQDDTANE